MAVSAIVAAVSTASVALTTGAFILGSAVSHFLVSTVIGAALNALSKPSGAGAGVQGFLITFLGSSAPHQIIYGEAEVAGVRVYDETTDSNTLLHRIYAFAGHEIDSFQTIYFDGEALTIDGGGNVTAPAKYVGFVRIKEHLGSPTQAADTDLIAESNGQWTSNHRLREIAYLYIRFTYNAEALPNGIPEVTALIRGKKVFDTRTSLTVWSANSALCVRDYLINTNYGLGVPAAKIPDALVDTAANICEETVDAEDRYRTDGAFVTGVDHADILGDMVGAMTGTLWHAQAEWRMLAGKYVAPTFTFDENDLRSGVSVQTRHASRDNFNAVRGQWRGAESNWQITDYPEVATAAFLTEDNNIKSVADLNLPFSATSTRCRRIANVGLERHRQQLTVKAIFGRRAMLVQVGDNISLTNARFGWTSKVFEVVEWTYGLRELEDTDVPAFTIEIAMTLRETATTVFDDIADGITYINDNTNLLSPFDVPAVGLALSGSIITLQEKLVIVITASVTAGAAAARVDMAEVQFKKATATDWISAGRGPLGDFEILDVEPLLYDVRARAISALGRKGDWTTTNDFDADIAAPIPADVEGAFSNLTGATLTLHWAPSPDLGLSHYRIRHALEESGATWANAVTIVDRVPRPATSVTVPAQPGTYMIRAFSKSGVQSANYISVVVPEDYLDDFATTSTQTEETTFTGTKTDCEVISSALRIEDPSEDNGLLIRSEDFSIGHSAVNCTVTVNDINSPIATLTADKIDGSNGGSALEHRIGQNSLTVVQDDVYNYSCYCKADELDFVRLFAFHASGFNDSAWFDLAAGSIISDSSFDGSAVVTDEGGGWYRCSFNVKNDQDTGTNVYVLMSPDGISATYDATTFPGGVHLWGHQMTEGAGVKTYFLSAADDLNNKATYDFATYIDTTAVRRVRTRVDINVTRVDLGAGLFDDLSGLFDSAAGLFDDLTGAADFADTNVRTFISITDDDPAVSPTWTPYFEFQAGEFHGRAFRFRAILESSAHDVTPSITGLTARVQY